MSAEHFDPIPDWLDDEASSFKPDGELDDFDPAAMDPAELGRYDRLAEAYRLMVDDLPVDVEAGLSEILDTRQDYEGEQL